MATTTTKQDEDLIIINSDSQDEDIFNFGETNTLVKEEVISKEDSSDMVLDFLDDSSVSTVSQTELKEEAVSDIGEISFDLGVSEIEGFKTVTESPKETEVSDALDFSINLDDSSTQALQTETKEEINDLFLQSDDKKEEVSVSSLDDDIFGGVSSESLTTSSLDVQSVSDSVESEELGDINTILDQTIAKLTSRKNVIGSQKDDKSSKVQDLKSEIKKLEEMVEKFNSEIESLEVESKKIDKNISSIEKMKSESVEIDLERPRQHNLNNIKKSK